MKIEIKNWNLFTLVVFILVMISIGIGIAVYDPSYGSHETLWSDRIEPKTADKVIISGNVEVTGDLKVDGEIAGSGAGGGTGTGQGTVIVYSLNKACSKTKGLTLDATCKTMVCSSSEGGDNYASCDLGCWYSGPATCPNDVVGYLVSS